MRRVNEAALKYRRCVDVSEVLRHAGADNCVRWGSGRWMQGSLQASGGWHNPPLPSPLTLSVPPPPQSLALCQLSSTCLSSQDYRHSGQG